MPPVEILWIVFSFFLLTVWGMALIWSVIEEE